jgi:hypothetical protein
MFWIRVGSLQNMKLALGQRIADRYLFFYQYIALL